MQVEAALTVIRSALANGVSWSALEELVSIEKKAGNPIASLILKLKVCTYRNECLNTGIK
jgi:hypothetical protein